MSRPSALVTSVKRFAVNGRLATGNNMHTVVWGLRLTGEEIANALTSGAYLGFVCTTCNDEAARCPELSPFLPAGVVAAAYDHRDEAPVEHGHDRHECPMCGHAMWSGGFSFDSTVSCGACSYREKRKPGKDYDACRGGQCASRVPA